MSCFLVSGGWKVGFLISMLLRKKMWHPNSGGGVRDASWAEVLETLGGGPRLSHVFWDLYLALKYVLEDMLDRLFIWRNQNCHASSLNSVSAWWHGQAVAGAAGALVFCKIKAFWKHYILWTCQHLKQVALSAAQVGLLLLLSVMYYCCLFIC